jgi:hypothetical protein
MMMRKAGILDEVRRLPSQERMDVLEGIVEFVELVIPPLSPGQEQGLIEAVEEADPGDLVDGADALAGLRRRVRGAVPTGALL